MTGRITRKLKTLSNIPGVYLFKDKKGRIIYVGKSANLKARVRSYFQRGATFYNAAKLKMLEQIADIETIETGSEIEALVKEAELIKKLKPRFNVLFRDSKNYVYIGFTHENYPRMIITHQPSRDLRYIGPYTDAKAVRRTLILLRKIFPYYTKRSKPSKLEIQLGLVPTENISPADYKNNVRALKSVLGGKSRFVLAELNKEIKAAVVKDNFELAKELKEKYENLESVIEHAHVLGAEISAPPLFEDTRPNFKLLGLAKDPKRIEAYDISNIQGNEAVGSMIVFERTKSGDYKPKKSDYRKFKIKTIKGANDPAMMAEVIERRLTHNEWPTPGLIVVDGGKAQLGAALKTLGRRKIPAIALAKRLEEVYFPGRKDPVRADRLGQATKHLLQALRDETHRFAITFHRKLHRKALIDY